MKVERLETSSSGPSQHRGQGGTVSETVDRPMPTMSHPIPDPTRMADQNRVRGARLYTGTLIDWFFPRAELVPVVIPTIYVITKIIFIYKKNYHQSGVHQNLYTYTESHLLIHVQFFSNTKHQRSRK